MKVSGYQKRIAERDVARDEVKRLKTKLMREQLLEIKHCMLTNRIYVIDRATGDIYDKRTTND